MPVPTSKPREVDRLNKITEAHKVESEWPAQCCECLVTPRKQRQAE